MRLGWVPHRHRSLQSFYLRLKIIQTEVGTLAHTLKETRIRTESCDVDCATTSVGGSSKMVWRAAPPAGITELSGIAGGSKRRHGLQRERNLNIRKTDGRAFPKLREVDRATIHSSAIDAP